MSCVTWIILSIRGTGQGGPHEVQQGEEQKDLHMSVQVGSSLADNVPGALVDKLNTSHQCILTVTNTNHTHWAALARAEVVFTPLYSPDFSSWNICPILTLCKRQISTNWREFCDSLPRWLKSCNTGPEKRKNWLNSSVLNEKMLKSRDKSCASVMLIAVISYLKGELQKTWKQAHFGCIIRGQVQWSQMAAQET